jgi:hypothetical protein
MSFEDSAFNDCYGINSFVQVATAEAVVAVGCSTQMTISWDSLVELANDGYDWMELYVDDVLIASASSRGEGSGCDYMGQPNSYPEPPVQVSLNRGIHSLRIVTDTRDALYHRGAYYAFQLSLQPD